MKLKYSLFVCPLLLIGCTEIYSGYSITGKAPDGAERVVLEELIGKNPVPVDTVCVKDDGTFVMEGQACYPVMAYLSVCDGGTFAQFCLSNDSFNVVNRKGTSEFEVCGGDENEWYKSVIAPKQNDLSSNKDLAYSFMDSLITENPDKVSLSYFLFRVLYHTLDMDQLEVLASKFNSDVKSQPYLKILSRLIDQTRVTQPGHNYIDFVSKNVEGESCSFSSFFDGKSYILLDFWASWCPYCRKENPSLVELYSKLHEKGFEIISVSLDSEKSKWIDAIEQDRLQWDHLSNLDRWECEAARLYGISGIPGNILFSPDGTIIARNLHGEDLCKLLTNKLSNSDEK